MHTGLDIRGKYGDAVRATGSGKVVYAARKGGYGNFVEIDHGNGLITRYAHMNAILVKKGQRVKAGFQIGKVGSTGRSTGPHLHFEIRRDQSAVNPADFLAVSHRLKDFIS
ncbi:MAG: M23 family metallopeptidase [Devosiaceae bacterium]|nr:M23 family metallopeptidase [Devosiaceae bacterium]